MIPIDQGVDILRLLVIILFYFSEDNKNRQKYFKIVQEVRPTTRLSRQTNHTFAHLQNEQITLKNYIFN